jgi:type I restriction enzyme, R subunit
LQALEQILFDDSLKKEALENELGKPVDLVSFITGLLGLSETKVDQSFAKFINDYQLNSVQIEFLNTIKKFLTKNGTVNPEMLYDSPFIKYHNLGIEGVFDEKQTDEIFEIISEINEVVKGVG